MSGTLVHLLERPTLTLCSSPAHQTKEHHVPLGWCGREDSGLVLGGVPIACFELFLLWLWLVYLILGNLPMRIAVANEDLRQLFAWSGGSRIDELQPQKEQPKASY